MITIKRDALRMALGLAQRAMSKQILQKSNTVLLSINGQELTVEGTNLHYKYISTLPIENDNDEATWILDFQLLYKIIQRCPEVEITLSSGDNGHVELNSGHFSASLDLLAELPFTQDFTSKDIKPIELPNSLKDLAKSVSWAADKDALRPKYSCCMFTNKDGKTIMAATDSVMMAIATQASENDADISILIPIHTVEELTSLDLDSSTVNLGPSEIIVDKETTSGHVQLASKLFNIEYPNIVKWVDDHIPTEGESIPVSVVEILEVLNRLSIMPKKDFNASVGSGELLYPAYMTYVAKEGELTFKVDMPGFEVEDVVATEVADIPDFTVRIDMRKLSRALEGALVLSPTDIANITYLGEKKPIKIEAASYLALVMPLVSK